MKETTGKTAKAVAKQDGVSEKTVRLNAEFAKAVNQLEEITPGKGNPQFILDVTTGLRL